MVKAWVPRGPRSSRSLGSVGVLCAALSLALLPACGFRVPKPPMGSAPADEMVEVPYPPPAVRVEVVPPRKGALDVWVDGQWDWDGEVWQWTAGSWMEPPANAYFTPWKAERREDGQLFFARASWRTKEGAPLAVAPEEGRCGPAPSAARAGEVTKR